MTDRPKVLVLWYSQSGQLRRAAENAFAPLEEAGFDVRWEPLRPRREFPFPWDLGSFLTVFPDAVGGRGCELEEPTLTGDERFDLVVIAYTVWYLSPSLPAQAIFDSRLRGVLRDTPVMTFITCRNMYFTAERKMRRLLRDAGARHAGTIAVTDDAPAWATFVTTPRWLLTGRRDRFLRIFPPPGIGDDTMRSLRRFGEAIVERFETLRTPAPHALLEGLDPLDVDRPMVVPDVLIGRLFRPAARLLDLVGARRGAGRVAVLAAFGTWLFSTVTAVVPLTVLGRIVMRPYAERATDRILASLEPGADR